MPHAPLPGPTRLLAMLSLGACLWVAVPVGPAAAQGGVQPAAPSATTSSVPAATAAPTTARPATTAAPTTVRPTTAAPRTTARPATSAPRTTARPATTTTEEVVQEDVAILAETTVPTTAAPTTAAPATTVAPSTSAAPVLQERVTESDDATTRLNRVVIALLALAAVITAVTVFFWRRTRPEAPASSAAPAAHWVDGSGAQVPLPEEPSGPQVDPAGWSVGDPPRLHTAPVPVVVPGTPSDVRRGPSGGRVAPAVEPVAGVEAEDEGEDGDEGWVPRRWSSGVADPAADPTAR